MRATAIRGNRGACKSETCKWCLLWGAVEIIDSSKAVSRCRIPNHTGRMVVDLPDMVRIAAQSAGCSAERVEQIQISPNLNNLRTGPNGGKYVLYWCTQALRIENNEALATAAELARELRQPLVVVISIDLRIHRKNSLRLLTFILEGVVEFGKALQTRSIPVFLRMDPNVEGSENANLSITGPGTFGDKEYRVKTSMKGPRGHKYYLGRGFSDGASVVLTEKRWMGNDIESVKATAKHIPCPLFTINTQTLFPLPSDDNETLHSDGTSYEIALDKFHRRIRDGLPRTLPKATAMKENVHHCNNVDFKQMGFVWAGTEEWMFNQWSPAVSKQAVMRILDANEIFLRVNTQSDTRGGEHRAQDLLAAFVSKKLQFYGIRLQEPSNIPGPVYGSLLSPYLNCGFISVAAVVSAVLESENHTVSSAKDANELFYKSLGRREIAYRTAHFSPFMELYEHLPSWIRTWLEQRSQCDVQGKTYSGSMTATQWAKGATSNSRWNTSK